MSGVFQIDPTAIRPAPEVILRRQGVTGGTETPARLATLLDRALNLFDDLARPRGILSEITLEDFRFVYRGEGRNEPNTPLTLIIPKADRLALFAATIGEEISSRIKKLFDGNDFALGYMLDAVASEGADITAESAAESFSKSLQEAYGLSAHLSVLSYSPGYCGWHVSGQKRLFEYLRPEQIGISLNSSFLMNPLKSVSGILVAGESRIHGFNNNYPFCEACEDRVCRARIPSAAEVEEG